jgi:molybdopterin-guanine dinucleotide biosynthesis protein A
MLRRVTVALRRAGAGHIACVGSGSPRDDARRRGALAGLGVAAVADDHPGAGPLGGILTALRTAPDHVEVVLVVACDLLAPSPAALEATVVALGDADVAVPHGSEWLHSAWHRRAEAGLRERFEAGERSVHRAVEGLAIAVADVDPAACLDADLPGELPSS